MIYLASPYSHSNPLVCVDRFKRVCLQAGKMLEAGMVVFSPIAHSHPIVEYALPDRKLDCEFWLAIDCEMLMKSEKMYVLMLDGWRESKGVQAEIQFCKAHDIDVYYIKEGNLE